LEEIKEQWYSLNAWRYVWVVEKEKVSDEDFGEKISKLNNEFKVLTEEAHELEKGIFENISKLV
jgi:type I restriction-modification system DNA methylase subunit